MKASVLDGVHGMLVPVEFGHWGRVEECLEVLRRVGLKLASERDLDRLLGLIVDETTRVLNAERSTLYLIEPESSSRAGPGKRVLVSRVAQGRESIRLSLDGNSIAAAVALSGRSVNLEDAYQDPRFDPSWDRASGFRTRSILAVPIRTPRDDVIGVLQALNKRGGRRFEEWDERMLMALSAQAGMAVENARYLEAQRSIFRSLIRGQAVAIDARDHITSGHTWRVAAYAVEIGRALGWEDEDLEMLEYAGLLHDQGKLGVPDHVLMNPGNLSEGEFQIMKTHAAKTREILVGVKNLFPKRMRSVPDMAAAHHEKLDGSGYPDGLRGQEIPQGARIVAVADVFDALTSKRPYREPRPDHEALEFLKEEAQAGRLDSQVVEALEGCLDRLALARERIELWVKHIGVFKGWDGLHFQDGRHP